MLMSLAGFPLRVLGRRPLASPYFHCVRKGVSALLDVIRLAARSASVLGRAIQQSLGVRRRGAIMVATITRIIGSLTVSLGACGSAVAASSPIGVWIDQTGRGAVEITDCGGKLCGHLVWFKDAKHSKGGCNFQIIGNVRPVAGNKWDGGWIIDPDKDPNKKYDVEITPLGDQKLKVMGYAGMKFLSETMTWTRAPADVENAETTRRNQARIRRPKRLLAIGEAGA